MDTCKVLIILELIFQPCFSITWVNMTITYDYVATDEIVILQNAIQEDKKIYDMPVGPFNISSNDVPPAPFDFHATAISPNSINASWSPVNVTIDGNLTVEGYTVFYRKYQYADSQWEWVSCQNKLSMVVERLEPYTTYILRVLAFHSMGNGISSQDSVAKTLEGTPPEEPKNLTCNVDSARSVILYWTRVMEWRGFKKSYTAIYKTFTVNENFTTVTFSPTLVSGSISGLKPNTRYELYFTADTSAGSGPQAWCVFKTSEGVPSAGPVITDWELDQYRPTEAIISWNPIPDNCTNGKLLYYNIFYGISREGKKSLPPEMKVIKVDQYTTRTVIKSLPTDVELTVYIAGETIIGLGNKSNSIYIESCKCPTNIYTAWYESQKLIYGVRGSYGYTTAIGGIIYDFLHQMIDTICSQCPGLKKGNRTSTLYWDRTKDGHSQMRLDENDLKSQVAHNVHFHLPVSGRKSIETFQSEFKYVSIISSPGIAFIVRDASADFNKSQAVADAIFKCWPAVIIIFLFSVVSGMFMWVLDRNVNKTEFPNESFLRGVYHGTYWAFVSMTTIGYGDKTPRSTPAKIAAVIWMITGPITNAIVIGTITTNLTSVKLSPDPILYGSKVGAIDNSFEYALGVRRNAIMNPSGMRFSEEKELLAALENKLLDGILLDSLKAASVAGNFSERKIKISKIIPEEYGWGVILASDMIKLENDIRSYVFAQAENTKKIVENITEMIPIQTELLSVLDTGLIDPKSNISRAILLYGSIIILTAVVIGLIVEFGILRSKKQKLRPYSAKETLEIKLSKLVRKFCDYLRLNIELHIQKDEDEISEFFRRKGYSLGVYSWVRYLTVDEEVLKKQMKYQEMMCLDLNESISKEPNSWTKLREGARVLHHKDYNIL